MIERKTKVVEGYGLQDIPYQELLEAGEPVILKGLVSEWELVKAGLRSSEDAIDYIKSFYNGKTVGCYRGPSSIRGRLFYTDDMSGMNFDSSRVPMDEMLELMKQHLHDQEPPAIYIGSTTRDVCLPGLKDNNDLVFNDPMFENNMPLASIWIGLPSTASAHYDAPNNIACCAVGRRRFTLFPPEQVANLYPGPLEPAPGGQAISMVDFQNPDFEKYPLFEKAIAAGQIADLEPGDALFYPSMWWHHVEASGPFNVLVNYWWSTCPRYMGTPMNALYHALLSLRDRPDNEKEAWRAIFDYYVFGSAERPREHLPEQAWGDLGPLDDMKARRLRAMLINKLNR